MSTHLAKRLRPMTSSPWISRALALALVAGSAAPLAPALTQDAPARAPETQPGSSPSPAPAAAPAPAQPAADPATPAATTPATPAATPAPAKPKPEFTLDPVTGRRALSDEPTTLAFKGVTIDQVIPFIVESTGKVVLPQQDILARRITLLNDQPIPRSRALDLVFIALQQAGVGIVETRDLIVIRDINEITRQDVPVVGPDQTLADRTDLGTIVEKVFALKHASAENIGKIIKDSLPDFVKYYADTDSNQIVVMANVALLQRLERLITSLDRPNAQSLDTRTFRLRFADATVVADNIRELFGSGASGSRTQQTPQNPREAFRAFFGGGGGGGNQGGGGQGRPGGGGGGGGAQPAGGGGQARAASGDQSAVSATLRVTSNPQQNSVTVVADPQVLEQIARQVETVWDQPLPDEAVVPRVYNLKYSDPVKLRSALEGLFGAPGSQNAAGGTNQGGSRLSGQFSFQAIPEAQRLVVISKSPDNLKAIDDIIEQLDKPLTAGLPRIVELKHASAEELSEQLNALLSQEGTLAAIRRAESGLSDSSSTISPFASTDTAATTQNQQQQTTNNDLINFWWQRARPPTDSAGSSNLVGKLRIVPVWRQNAVMIMGSPEYQESLVQLIEQLDKPGRQVLVSAIIVELSKEDADALGIRWSNTAITPSRQDNAFAITSNMSGQQDNFIGDLFNTSVLDVGVDLNVLIQALNEKTDVSILSEPRIFTSDNQEAEFFDGQDIPFITDTQSTDQGNLINSFDYRAVGISLRVRPRITPKRDVDLKINLELSSIQPQQTLFGGFIVDRRESTTQLIVRDGQTVVLSGIMRSEDSDVKRKVPILGDIPVLGLAFQSTEKVKTNTELVAFITPIVVENPDEADSVNEQFRKRLQEMRNQLAPGVAEPILPPASTDQRLDPKPGAAAAPRTPVAPRTPDTPRRPEPVETGSPG
jgi:type II secretion system protein D